MRPTTRCLLATVFCLIASGCDSSVTNTPASPLFENPEPLPLYLQGVQPAPGATVSLRNPDDWEMSGGEIGYMGLETGLGVLCVTFRMNEQLVDPSADVEIYEEFELYLNGEIVAVEPAFILPSPPGQGAKKELVCWSEGLLSEGMHFAELHVSSTAGASEFTYSWAFEVVD
jgi:hypothetical protein